MMNGLSRLSYCAASTMYMKAIDSSERPAELAERALELAAAAADRGGVARRHAELGGGGAQRLEAIGKRIAGRDAGPHVGLALPIEPIDARRALAFFERHDRIEAHHLAVGARHVEARDGVGIAAIVLRQPQLDVVVLADLRIAEARHFLVAADHQPQRRRDILRA